MGEKHPHFDPVHNAKAEMTSFSPQLEQSQQSKLPPFPILWMQSDLRTRPIPPPSSIEAILSPSPTHNFEFSGNSNIPPLVNLDENLNSPLKEEDNNSQDEDSNDETGGSHANFVKKWTYETERREKKKKLKARHRRK